MNSNETAKCLKIHNCSTAKQTNSRISVESTNADEWGNCCILYLHIICLLLLLQLPTISEQRSQGQPCMHRARDSCAAQGALAHRRGSSDARAILFLNAKAVLLAPTGTHPWETRVRMTVANREARTQLRFFPNQHLQVQQTTPTATSIRFRVMIRIRIWFPLSLYVCLILCQSILVSVSVFDSFCSCVCQRRTLQHLHAVVVDEPAVLEIFTSRLQGLRRLRHVAQRDLESVAAEGAQLRPSRRLGFSI